MAAYLAPAPLDCLVRALEQEGGITAWDAVGLQLPREAPIPQAGEAIQGHPSGTLPASLRAHPRAVLAAGSDWVLCVEDGVHATLFARRASIVVRAVQATVSMLVARPAHPRPRIDPRVLGHLARPTFRGPHRLQIDPLTTDLWVHSPRRTLALAPNTRGSWRLIQ